MVWSTQPVSAAGPPSGLELTKWRDRSV